MIRSISCTWILLTAAAVTSHDGPARASQAQTTCVPKTEADVLGYLKAEVPPVRVRARIQECGVTFVLDAAGEARFRRAGANEEIIALLAPPRNPSPNAPWIPPVDKQPMMWVPGGQFQLGSRDQESDRDADEAAHLVKVSGFWMDETEVTKEAYRNFVIANPQWQKGRIDPALHDGAYLRDWNGNEFPQGQGDRPVVYISWYAANAYAAWAAKRLPSEAEWEYAARASTSSRYWWGDEFGEKEQRANAGMAAAIARNVATRNPLGLHHMLGNVWEWTSSAYAPYPYNDAREKGDTAASRTVRGGSWGQHGKFLRSANRQSLAPTSSVEQVGFRCAR
jgi:formylglycine-generating enzyme required for sulfatase activity